MAFKKIDACLRIYSEILDINQISEYIAATPDHSFCKGTPASKRNPKSQIRSDNLWIYNFKTSDQRELDLEFILNVITQFICEKSTNIFKIEIYTQLDVYIAMFTDNEIVSFSIDDDIMKLLSAHKISMSFDVFTE